MTRNPYLGRLREASLILGKRSNDMMNQPVIPNDLGNLRSHLLQLRGNGDGVYFNSQYKPMPSKLTLLTQEEKALADQWERHCKQQLNYGSPEPKTWPPELQEKKDKLDAKITVCEEEIRWLEKKLEAAETDKKAREHRPTNPRFWGAGRLRNNELVEFCGWDVAPDDTGLLRISDPTSPYYTLEIWRLKSQVINPLFHEFKLRRRKEANAAEAENRPRKEVPFPTPPTYRKETGTIEYPNYSNEVIRKLKLQDD